MPIEFSPGSPFDHDHDVGHQNEQKAGVPGFSGYKRSLIYAAMLLPPFGYFILTLAYFESQIHITDKKWINLGINYSHGPIIAIRFGHLGIFGCYIAMFVGILWKSKHPVVAFGASFQLVFFLFIAFFSVLEFKFSLARFENRTSRFDISTPEERRVTKDQLEFLLGFQKEHKCCGLENYMDFDTKFDVKNAIHDNTTDNCTLNLTWRDFVRTRYTAWLNLKGDSDFSGVPPNGKIAEAFKAVDVPASCCIDATKDPSCNKGIFTNSTEVQNGTVSNKIYTQGCAKEFMKNLQPLKSLVLHVNLFLMPWIVTVWSIIVCWCHLRATQGLSWRDFGPTKLPHLDASSKTTTSIKEEE